MIIDPATVFLGRPIYGRCTPGHETSVLQVVEDRSVGAAYNHNNESEVSSARDYVVHYFLTRTNSQWLVWVDSDITFSRQDWEYLLEQQGDELAVCGEYMKKTLDLSPQVANFGLGFARVHRSVYEKLDALTHEDGSPRMQRYRRRVDIQGTVTVEDFVEYHPVGVLPDGSRRNEDHGFWLMVSIAGIPIRKEKRTRLGHTGDFTWWYDPEKVAALEAAEGAQ